MAFLRRIVYVGISLALLVSLSISIWRFYNLWHDPAFSMLVDASSKRIESRLNKMAAAGITQPAFDKKMNALLNAEPRNWVAIEAVEEAAADQGLSQPQDIITKRGEAYDEDHGWMVTSGKCAACAWNWQYCEMSAILLCRAPIEMTPIADVLTIIDESGNYVMGKDIDTVGLVLATVGTGAEVLAVVSGGSTLLVKAGATTLKAGIKLGKVSDKLLSSIKKTGMSAFDWSMIAKTTPSSFFTDIRKTIRPQKLRPLMSLADSTGQLNSSLGMIKTLHVLRFVDNAKEARQLARAVKAGGSKTVGRLEFLGKSKVLRATLRYAKKFVYMCALIASLSLAIIALLGHLVFSLVMKRIRCFSRQV